VSNGAVGGEGGEGVPVAGIGTAIRQIATSGGAEGDTGGNIGAALLGIIAPGAFPSFAGSGKTRARQAAAKKAVRRSPILSELKRVRKESFGGMGDLLVEAIVREDPSVREAIGGALLALAQAFGSDRGVLFNEIFGERARSDFPGNQRQKLDTAIDRILNPERHTTTRSLPTERPEFRDPPQALPGTTGRPIPIPKTRTAEILDFLLHNLPGFLQVYLAWLRTQQQHPPTDTDTGGGGGPFGFPVPGRQPDVITINVPPGGGGGGAQVSHVDTSIPVSAGGGILGELIRVGGGIARDFLTPQLQPIQERSAQRVVLPGGAGGGGFQNVDFSDLLPDLPGFDITAQGTSALTSPFRRTAAGASAQPHVRVNPANGRQEWFRPAGRPVMFSKDLGICRKVETLAKRAHKSVHRRRTRKR